MGRRVGSASLSAIPVDTPNHHIVVNQTIQEVERMSDVLSDLNSVSTAVNALQDLGTTDTPTFAGITATATILTNSVQTSTLQADNTITGGNFTTADEFWDELGPLGHDHRFKDRGQRLIGPMWDPDPTTNMAARRVLKIRAALGPVFDPEFGM